MTGFGTADQGEARHTELRRHAMRGAATMVGARFVGTAASIGATAVLARFVAPREFGAVAMVTSVLALARALEEVGLGDAAVQREEISNEQASALFWLNAACGALLTIAGLLAAPSIAAFYERPELTAVAMALSPLFLLSALGGQHRAHMRRHFRFGHLAKAQTAGIIGGAIAGCTAAVAGLGLWSLVIQNLAGAATLLAGCWIGSGWRPSAPARAAGLRPLLAFGSSLASAQLLVALTRNIDTILIGRFVSAGAAGAYDRAFQLMSIPASQFNRPLSTAIVPALARLQNDAEGYRRLYRDSVAGAATIAFPAAVFLAVAAPAIVGVVLGPAWSESAQLLRALSPLCLLTSLNVLTGWAYQSLGRTTRALAWTIFGSIMAVVAIFVGIRWGALGVALSLSAVRALLRIPAILVCYHGTPLRLRDAGAAIWPSAASAGIGGMAALAADPTGAPAVVRLVVQGAVFLLVTGAATALLPGSRARLARVRNLLSAVGGGRVVDAADRMRSMVEKPLQSRRILSTAGLRLPDFIGIGAQKAGTTWLYENLRRHPGLFLPDRKELHYFDRSFHRPLSWYAEHFEAAGERLAGEITPAYALLDDARIGFIARTMPRVRAIMLLRDPVERAWSSAQMEATRGGRPLAEIDWTALALDPGTLARSRYLGSIDRWQRALGADRLLVLFHDDIEGRPGRVLEETCGFLGAPGSSFEFDEESIAERVFAGPEIEMPPIVRERLVEALEDELEILADRFGGAAEIWRRRWLR